MISTSCIPLIALVLLLSQTIAIAGSLTITVRVTIQEFKDHIKVAITFTNDGPETAYWVGAKLYTLEQTWTTGTFKELPVKDTEIFTFKSLLGSQHPYYFFLEYDQDGQHYSNLTGGKINVGDIRVNWFIRTRWYWLSGLGTWLLIWGI